MINPDWDGTMKARAKEGKPRPTVLPPESVEAARRKQREAAEAALQDCEATIGRIRERLRSALWTERSEDAAYFARLQLLRLEQTLTGVLERHQPRKSAS